jgi:hypothetical protein
MSYRLGFWQEVKLRAVGYCFLENRKMPSGGILPFYLVKCKKHGLFETYPAQWERNFYCPKCIEEEIMEFKVETEKVENRKEN